jgi:hypothetical protein
MSETTIHGSCLCKGIHFTVTGQDKGAVLCHCTNCKSFAGSAYAHNYRMMKTKIEYQKGQDLVRSYKDGATKSGKVLERFFCSVCVCWTDFLSIYLLDSVDSNGRHHSDDRLLRTWLDCRNKLTILY